MSKTGFDAAASAVVRIIIGIGFTAIGGVLIAVTKRLLAVRNTANSRTTDGCPIRRIWANVLANIAVVDADI